MDPPSACHGGFMTLEGKCALVTGAASGIGLATVEGFCARGARVALNYLPDDARGATEVERLRAAGYEVFPAPGNVGRAGEAEEMVGRALKTLGGLDYLVNNAGTSGTREPIPFENLDAVGEVFWTDLLSTNLLGPFRCTKTAASALRARKGAVVNTASVAGLGMRASSVAYAASKAGLINLTKSLARALAPDVRVNAVAPGIVDSPWIAEWPERRRESSRQNSLLQTMSQPADIADVILFLCAGTRMINSETIVVNGGSVTA
jgi:3-oxoacyl-[acyl-carrier protein] reductase